MARIAGVDLPREKKLEIGLTYIFGIGRATAQRILNETGVNADQRVRLLFPWLQEKPTPWPPAARNYSNSLS